MHGFLVFQSLLFFSSFVLAQNTDKQLKKLQDTWTGTIVFNDDSELNCQFNYYPLNNDGTLIVKTDTATQVLSVNMVRFFSFFDDDIKMRRFFYSLPIHIKDRDITRKYFVELIHDSNQISILGRSTVKVKVRVYLNQYNPYPILASKRDKTISKTYVKYLLDHRDNTVYEFSKKQILRMIEDKRDEVIAFIRHNNFHLNSNNVDEYIAVIDYYSSLKN